MNLKNSALKYIFSEEEVEEERFDRPRMLKAGHLNILVRTPKTFADVRAYADSLIHGDAVMISFDHVDAALRNRIFDYLNGVGYIVGAQISRINDDLLLYAPAQVAISKEAPVKRSVRSFFG